MMLVPFSEVVLNHRAYHVAAAAESGHIAAISRKGRGSLISPDHLTTTLFRGPVDPSDLSVAATGRFLAIAGRGGLTIIPTSTFTLTERLDDSFESSKFCGDDVLWSALKPESDTIVLCIRNFDTRQIVAQTEIPDPFGDSCVTLLSHPDGKHVVVWVAAGQDGQCLFWASRDGSAIAVHRLSDLEETTPASFNSRGDQFLVVCGAELRRYGFPGGDLVGRMRWPSDAEDNQIGDLVSFVDEGRAVLASNEGRLHLVDLEKMLITDEIILQGHEPKPMPDLYPNLGEGRGVCSDLAYFLPLSTGGFLSVHRDLYSQSDDDHDHLLIWRMPS